MRESLLSDSNVLFFETFGLSMSPFLNSEERIVVKTIPPQDFKIGDIILYQLPGASTEDKSIIKAV